MSARSPVIFGQLGGWRQFPKGGVFAKERCPIPTKINHLGFGLTFANFNERKPFRKLGRGQSFALQIIPMLKPYAVIQRELQAKFICAKTRVAADGPSSLWSFPDL